MYTTLIEPQELAAHLADPHWALLDCRFDLARPAWGAKAYAEAHIPGALYAHLEHDLSGAHTPHSGRHPLPAVADLGATFGRFGIDSGVQVIAYDQGNGAYAARLWWLVRWLGHRAVAVLNGGLSAWQHAGLPLSDAPVTRAPRTFRAAAAAAQLATQQDILAGLGSGAFLSGAQLLVDARAADRFAGQNETLDPVAGHIPGARNHPYAGNLDAAGRFLPAAELRAAWQRTLGAQTPQRLIAMCGSGVTACHNLLALEHAGLPGARLYAGSWSEWIRDPSHAVELGPPSRG